MQGWDASNLYGKALSDELPVSVMHRWLPINDSRERFKAWTRDSFLRAYDCLDWLAVQRRVFIKHKLNSGKECRIGPYPVDGYHAPTDTVYQFSGCYYHGHSCQMKMPEKERKERYDRARKISRYLATKVACAEEVWECEFLAEIRANRDLGDFVWARQPEFYRHNRYKTVSPDMLLEGIRQDTLYGFAEVDIHVPPDLESYFEEMCPLFGTTPIPFDEIGDTMQDLARQRGLSEKPRPLLIAGLRAERILLATPLLRWYMRNGLQITRMYEVVECRRERPFHEFIWELADVRRQALKDPALAPLGNLAKLIANSR